MATDSTFQLRRKTPAAVDNATEADQLRVFLNDVTGLLAVKDNVGNVFTIGGVATIAFVHNAAIGIGDSPYSPVVHETVKVDPSGGNVLVDLPTAIGSAGEVVRIISLSPQPGPPANNITVQGILGQTINGNPSFDLISAEESLEVESDGTNWKIV